jgi:hypothetical protein
MMSARLKMLPSPPERGNGGEAPRMRCAWAVRDQRGRELPVGLCMRASAGRSAALIVAAFGSTFCSQKVDLRRILSGLITIVLFLTTTISSATHIAGGEIRWQCLGSNTYVFSVDIYRKCDPLATGLQRLNLMAEGCGHKYRIPLCQGPVTEVSQTCTPTPCDGSGGIIYYRHTFISGTVTLPCTDTWQLRYTSANSDIRTSSVNVVNSLAQNLSIAAQVNSAICMDPPVLTNPWPIPTICVGEASAYSFMASSPDPQVSTVHSLVPAQSAVAVSGEYYTMCNYTYPPGGLVVQEDQPPVCGSEAVLSYELEEFTASFTDGGQRSEYIIPVVVHVIYSTPAENISDAQIHDAIDALNEDFNKLNPEWPLTHPAFLPIVADMGIEFRLARLDPNDSCTTGITRTQSTLTYAGDVAMKQLIQWPRQNYLNIWVCACPMGCTSGVAGYALFPAGAHAQPQNDGIVMRHDYMGSIGTAGGFSNSDMRAHTLAHEVAHFLNIMHTWGGSNTPALATNCSSDDNVADTPNTIGQTPSAGCSDLDVSTCGEPVDNVENFMNYAYCFKMFTEGQKTRALAALNSTVAQRLNLWQNGNLVLTGVADGYDCATDTTAPNPIPMMYCEGCTANGQHAGQLNPNTVVDVVYQPGYSSTVPIEGASLNAQAGVLSFTPPTIGEFIVAMRVDFYLNGDWAGYVIRDMSFRVVACANQPPTIPAQLSSGQALVVQDSIYVCPDQPFCFQVQVSDPDPSDVLTPIYSGPYQMTYAGTDPVVITICATGVAEGEHEVNVMVSDDACPINAAQAYGFHIIAHCTPLWWQPAEPSPADTTEAPDVLYNAGTGQIQINAWFTRWAVYDGMGRLVLQGSSSTIDLGHLAHGVYHVRTDRRSLGSFLW